MIVEYGPDKSGHIKRCIIAIVLGMLLFWDSEYSFIRWFIPTLLLCIHTVIYILHMSRIIYFKKEGCLISLWGFDKFYRWDEIQTRRVKIMGWDGTSALNTKAVFFCTKRLSKSAWLYPYKYWLRPMSFFYVHFWPEQPLTEREKKRVHDYGVDREEFLAKMAEWGVELE